MARGKKKFPENYTQITQRTYSCTKSSCRNLPLRFDFPPNLLYTIPTYKKEGYLLKRIIKPDFVSAAGMLYIASLVAAGVFHEYIACFFAAALSGVLLWQLLKEKKLLLRGNLCVWTVGILVAAYGVGILWALDRGMAFIGFLKFLPVGLFLLVLLQQQKLQPALLCCLPITMAAITVVCSICAQVPDFGEIFLVADRLAGTLQYPNTFALLLLISQLLVVAEGKWNVKNILVLAILLFGLIYSGSRTVFFLAVPAHLALALLQGSKKQRLVTLGVMLLCGGGILALALLSNSAVLGRFLRFSFWESTFAGRLLYWQDALPVILKHPFGLGYYGYYYIQQSVQTGVYATVFAHNDVLQLMLDVGWIPAILFVVVMIRPVFRKETPLVNKVVLCTMLLHLCFDFDLQFASIYFTLLLFLDIYEGKEKQLSVSKLLPATVCATMLVSSYMAVALLLPQLGQLNASRAMYAPNTQNNTQLLLQTESTDEGIVLAWEILEQNPYVTVSYSMLARHAFSQGDFTTVITCKNEIFNKAPFQHQEYIEYCQMLLIGINLYEKAGDTTSRDMCLQEAVRTRQKLETLPDRLSALGKIIKDQPTAQLPQQIARQIDLLTGGKTP